MSSSPEKHVDITPPAAAGAPKPESLVIEHDYAVTPEAELPSPEDGGKDADRTSIRRITGFIEVVSAVPASVPKNFFEQIKIYKNGTTRRLYVYDFVEHRWDYSALT